MTILLMGSKLVLQLASLPVLLVLLVLPLVLLVLPPVPLPLVLLLQALQLSAQPELASEERRA
jgi:hypothetical protein